jgi:hypothetical protein
MTTITTMGAPRRGTAQHPQIWAETKLIERGGGGGRETTVAYVHPLERHGQQKNHHQPLVTKPQRPSRNSPQG